MKCLFSMEAGSQVGSWIYKKGTQKTKGIESDEWK